MGPLPMVPPRAETYAGALCAGGENEGLGFGKIGHGRLRFRRARCGPSHEADPATAGLGRGQVLCGALSAGLR